MYFALKNLLTRQLQIISYFILFIYPIQPIYENQRGKYCISSTDHQLNNWTDVIKKDPSYHLTTNTKKQFAWDVRKGTLIFPEKNAMTELLTCMMSLL